MNPRLRTANKIKAPYKLNEFPEEVVRAIAQDLIVSRYVRGTDAFEGADWEKTFARAIGADWKPSNVGLDDVQLGNCCWGAKTVKNNNPETCNRIRLISGRNSPDYSFGEGNVRKQDLQKLGGMILAIWNQRVSSVRQRFAHVRTVVLVKGRGLKDGCVFEFETLREEPERYTWSWNQGGNLEGRDENGVHTFTWQPSGSQFTIIHTVTERYHFKIDVPVELAPLETEAILESIGYKPNWIAIRHVAG